MAKSVFSQKGFWKSVLVLGLVYAVVLFVLKWAFSGFSMAITTLPISQYGVFLLCGLVAGLFSAYGKYWAKVQRDELKK